MRYFASSTYSRTTSFEYQSEKDADEYIAHYRENAPTNFPDAEILITTQVGPTTTIMNSLYPDKETTDKAAARKPLIEEMMTKIKNIVTQQVKWL